MPADRGLALAMARLYGSREYYYYHYYRDYAGFVRIGIEQLLMRS